MNTVLSPKGVWVVPAVPNVVKVFVVNGLGLGIAAMYDGLEEGLEVFTLPDHVSDAVLLLYLVIV